MFFASVGEETEVIGVVPGKSHLLGGLWLIHVI